jgi:hypothetical protein
MKITITESQYKKILLESEGELIKEKLETATNFFNKVSEETRKIVGFDLSMLVTFGAAIGGFVHPVAEFIQGKYPELSFTELALISTATIFTYYHSNKKILIKLLDEIKERGLIRVFNDMLEKAGELKKTFLAFVESLAIPIGKLGNMMAFTLIIPVLGDILNIVQNHNSEKILEIVYRTVMFVGVNYMSTLVKRLIFEIVKRFKS